MRVIHSAPDPRSLQALLLLSPRERVPLDWAGTQIALGTALGALGERESGTGKLEEVVAAYRAALEEWTRERAPLDGDAEQSRLCVAGFVLQICCLVGLALHSRLQRRGDLRRQSARFRLARQLQMDSV
jgi:hypothetical protein